MKMHRVVMLALFAVFAFSAVLASSASAVETLLADWLVGGNLISAELLVLFEGEIEVRNTIPIGFIPTGYQGR
jgi:hypothetical protein